MRPLLSLLVALSILSCNGQQEAGTLPEPRRVLADSIAMLADTLPEFRVDPHDTNDQGNQISGVVRTMLQDHRGWYWFGSQSGLCRYDGNTLMYYDLRNDQGQGVTVMALAEDGDGNLWIGHGGGISKYDGTYFTSYSERDGLVNNDVWSLAVDRRNTVWIGTIDGVSRFDGTRFSRFELPEGLPDSSRGVSSARMVHAIVEQENGDIWYGTTAGAFRYDGKDLSGLTERDGLASNFVYALEVDGDGGIYIGTGDGGMHHYDGTAVRSITTGTELEGEGAGHLLKDHAGELWFAVRDRGVYRYDGEELHRENDWEALGPHFPFRLYEDQQHRLWSVGFRGAYRRDADGWVNVTRKGPW